MWITDPRRHCRLPPPTIRPGTPLGADALWLVELDVLAVPLVACHPYHAARTELLRFDREQAQA